MTLKDTIKSLLVNQILKATSLPIVGFWGSISVKVVEILVSKILFPGLEALAAEGFLFIREKELKAKLKEYMEAQTNEDFDESFDNLISGSKFKL